VSFTDFYVRRFKRLLPALLFMVICVVPAACLLLAPAEQHWQATAAVTVPLWISNLFFASRGVDYFSPESATNLFLHTWSLSVEEQFYLVWPLLIAVAIRVLRGKHRTVSVDFSSLRWMMTAVAVLGLAGSIALTHAKPLWAFYLMPSRAWQFALGAIVALYSMEDAISYETSGPANGSLFGHRWARELAAGGGAALIIGSALTIDAQTPYPGTWAMAPSVGAALVLASKRLDGDSVVTRILSTSGLQSLGRISYSWYLWHWPVLLLGAAWTGSVGALPRAFLVALSLSLAAFSYWAVESPIRNHRGLGLRHKRLAIGASVLLMAGGAALMSGWEKAAEKWSFAPAQQRYSLARQDAPELYSMGCDDWYHSDRPKLCSFGNQAAKRTAVLLGDSVVAQWFPAVSRVFREPEWHLVVLTKSSCPMVDEPWFYKRIGAVYSVCARWREEALARVASLEPDVVITGSADGYDFTASQWIDGSRRVLERLARAAGMVFILRATPRLPFDGLDCLARRDWRPDLPYFRPECTAASGDPRGAAINSWLNRAAGAFSNASVLDLNALVCPRNRCDAERNGRVLFRDSLHLSASYVASLSGALASMVASQLRTRKESP
jgi:peptidoglycan/LPS O-acetylase OafA/YrhL